MGKVRPGRHTGVAYVVRHPFTPVAFEPLVKVIVRHHHEKTSELTHVTVRHLPKSQVDAFNKRQAEAAKVVARYKARG